MCQILLEFRDAEGLLVLLVPREAVEGLSASLEVFECLDWDRNGSAPRTDRRKARCCEPWR